MLNEMAWWVYIYLQMVFPERAAWLHSLLSRRPVSLACQTFDAIPCLF